MKIHEFGGVYMREYFVKIKNSFHEEMVKVDEIDKYRCCGKGNRIYAKCTKSFELVRRLINFKKKF